MATNPASIKVPKAALYKMVSYKGSTGGKKYTPLQSADEMGKMQGDMGKGFQAVIGGINSLGASINSIALGMQSMTSSMKLAVAKQIKQANKIEKVQEDALKEDKEREKIKVKDEARRRKIQQRDEAEKDSEVGKPSLFKRIGKSFKEQSKKTFGGLFSGLVRLSTYFLKIVVGFAALNWIAKNPEAIQRLAKTLASVGKFVLSVSSFLAGNAFNGLISFLENPISLKGLFGALQFVIAAAPLFATMAFLRNPIGTVRAFSWVIGTLGKSIAGMFKAGKGMKALRAFQRNKFARIGLGVGAGLGTAFSIQAAGGDVEEVVGGGIGAAGGSMLGAKLGEATGIPGMGMILGAAGGALGGKAGAGIGKMLKPIMEPLGRFFKMVGDTFNKIMEPIKDSLNGFFEAFGGVMNGVLDFIEPHMPLIEKILGIGIDVMFGPLFMGLKALTAVLKFFAPKADKEDEEETSSSKTGEKLSSSSQSSGETQPTADGVEETKKQPDIKLQIELTQDRIAKLKSGEIPDKDGYKLAFAKKKLKILEDNLSEGGEVAPPKFAKGGWINGPMSGYPVSLDGGKSTAFIGHGLEWVGSKMASGGAFVVPYNTPATKKDSGLTSRRFREAMQGGYALPQKSEGGEVEQIIGNVNIENQIMGQGYAIDIESLRRHQKQILKQLPEGTSIDDVIAGQVQMNQDRLINILRTSDAQKETHMRQRQETVKKLKKNFTNFITAERNEEGEATGWKRIYLGLADAYTGNQYDFDGRGDQTILEGAKNLKSDASNLIQQAKLALIDKKNELLGKKNQVIEAPTQTAPPVQMSTPGGQYEIPIPIDSVGAADPYLITRFGLVSEFNGDVAELM
jgi:hypothetical protein|tara:strand:- start:1505 stop:4057 length:2553 start_codon:yes stop_codon:yes gene_type:complete